MEVHKNTRDESTSYDGVFRENYVTLQRWALHITNERELAEDLVHDVYIHFIQKNHVPANVEGVDGYLYTALKNAYLSYLRRRTRTNTYQFSMLDFESADNALLVVDPGRFLRVHDQLRAICHYACVRKSASISASILILRYFHGYFSAEIALVVKRSRNAVEARLHKARFEMSDYLFNSREYEKSDNRSVYRKRPLTTDLMAHSDILTELREMVFSTRKGPCLSMEALRDFYFSRGDNRGLERDDLSHLVSCKTCLDGVNSLLRIPPLSDRHPLDTRGSQTTEEALVRNMPKASSAAASG